MKRRSRAEWERLIMEQEASGENQERFCLERGIALSSLQVWKRKLREEPFVEIGMAPRVDKAERAEAVVELPSGAVLRFSWIQGERC